MRRGRERQRKSGGDEGRRWYSLAPLLLMLHYSPSPSVCLSPNFFFKHFTSSIFSLILLHFLLFSPSFPSSRPHLMSSFSLSSPFHCPPSFLRTSLTRKRSSCLTNSPLEPRGRHATLRCAYCHCFYCCHVLLLYLPPYRVKSINGFQRGYGSRQNPISLRPSLQLHQVLHFYICL